ncbi:YDG domain-containing protein [Flavobacterium cyclinae]|uniref:YDG domain-containing protein n=1 Tax=Flavobacterium cyclinae TaxID=2895947 RepID=UPI001E315309|nr:YDG domain-containing protein [Flavobacterium cyclinae]UGS20584.1 YDG domain-containing protein [Flavobacterium cyclinae]
MKTNFNFTDWCLSLFKTFANDFFFLNYLGFKSRDDYFKFKGIVSFLMVFFLLLSSPILLAQGSEDFSNIPTSSSSSYSLREWQGFDNVTWTANGARTDQSMTGKAICFGNSGTRNVISPTYTGGIGTLTFDYVRAFTGTNARSIEVYVNGTQIGTTITVDRNSNTVITYSSEINVAGDVVLEIRSTGAAQVKVDNIAWTGYSAPSVAPVISSSLFANATYNEPLTYSIVAANSPSSYNAVGLPLGLSIDTSTGVISGNPLQVGVFSVTISATNATGTGDATLEMLVSKGNQSIIFDTIPSKVYGDSDFTLNASASSALAVTYVTSNPDVAIVTNNNIVSIVGVGIATITASQSGDDYYNAADPVGQELIVAKADQVISFEPLVEKLDSDADFQLNATSSSGLAITYTSSDNTVVSISGNIASIEGPGIVQITASQEGNENYNSALAVTQNQVVINTALESQEITFGALPEVTYGDEAFELGAVVDSGMPITYTSSDVNIASITEGIVTIHQPGVVWITASQEGGNGYNPAASVSQELVINKKSITVSNLIIEDKIYDGSFGATILSYSLNGIIGSDIIDIDASNAVFVDQNAGVNQSVIPNFILIGADVFKYELEQPSNLTGTILKSNQTISFTSLSNYTTAIPSFELNATATSGLSVSYSSSNTEVATINGNTVTIVGAGTTIITAYQDGDTNFNAATAVPQTLVITRAPDVFAAWQFGVPASSGNEVNYTSTTNDARLTSATLSRGAGVSPTSLGRAFASNGWNSSSKSEALDSNEYYEFSFTPTSGYAMSLNTLDVTLRRSSNTAPNSYIWMYSIDGIDFNEIGTEINYTSTADGAVQPQIDLSVVEALQNLPAGTLLTFRLYAWGATSSTATFSIGRYGSNDATNSLVVTGFVNQLPAPTITSSLSASGTVGQSFNYSTMASNVPSSYNASGLPLGLSINTSTGIISGVPTVAGVFNVSLSATNLSGTDTQELILTVLKSDQELTFDVLPSFVYGDLPFELDGTASSGLTVSYTSSNPSVATLEGNVLTIVGAGTTLITASQAGNDNYNSALEITRELVVNKADQTITFELLENRLDTDASFTLTASTTSGLPVSFISDNESVLSINGNVATILASGTVVITALQEGNDNYNAAVTVSQEQVIINTSLANQEITFEPIAEQVYGNAPIVLNATASSGLIVTYVSSDETIATIDGNSVNLLQPGTVTITANQVGNASYNPAPASSQSLVIVKKQLTVSEVVVADKSYDGTTSAQVSSYQLNGIVGVDEVELTNTAEFEQANVGQNIAVIPNFELVGLHSDRYTLVQPTNVIGNIVKADQVLVFEALPSKVYGDAAFEISALGGASGEPIVFTSSDETIATVLGNQITILAGGTVQITASQLGNENYNDAISVSQELVIAPRVQYINGFSSLGTKYISALPFALNATATSALDVSYTSSNTDVATVDGNVITIVGIGQTEITAIQEGSANYEPVTQVRSLKVIPDPIAAWNVYGLNQVPTATATTFTNLVATNGANLLTRGAGATASVGTNSFRTTGFKNDGIDLGNNDYFEFKLQPESGYQMNLTSIDANFVGTSTFYASPGVTHQFAYSIDGSNFNFIGLPITSTDLIIPTIDLTQISELQNIPNGTTVTFRYFASGQTSTGGWGLSSPAADSDALAIGGNLVTLPVTPQITVTQNCDGTVTLSTDATGTLLWSTNDTSSSITISTAGTYTVSQTIDGLTSNLGTVDVVPVVISSPIVDNQTFCSVDTPRISDIVVLGQNIKVYSDSEKTMLLSSETPLESATYYVTQTIDTCESEVVAVQITVNQSYTYYVDTDGDGYGSTTTVMLCDSTLQEGYSVNNTDCDDTNAAVWRTGDFYVDADADTYGTGEAVSLCYGTNTPAGYATRAGDCNDSSASVNPGATEICGNGIDDNCNGSIDEGCVVYSQVQSSQCGVTIGSLSTAIYANMISGATSYTFEVTEGSTVREFTPSSGLRYFNLNQLTGGSLYATTYSIRVNYLKSGVWSGYGPSCEVTTPAVPTSKVQTSQCGVTLASLGTQISANSVSNVTTYRFEVTDGLTVSTYDSATRQFQLTQVSGLSLRYATTYQIRVKLLINNGQWSEYGESCDVTTPSLPLTKVQTSQCGVTVAARETLIYADAVTGVSGYRFEVTRPNNTVAVVTTASGNDRSFSLSQVAADFGEAYSVRVAVLNNGVWGEYGTVCTVSAPDPLTQVQASQCGITLGSLTTPIYADAVSGATRYRFQVTRGSEVREYTTSSGSIRYFNLTQLDGGSNFGAAYFVKVAVEYRGSWRAYGTGCYVTTPTPTTKVQTSQCGITLASLNTIISANSVSNVSAYRFEVTKEGGEVRTFDSSTRQFYLAQLNRGSEFATYATTYSIRVALKSGGSWMEYGESCNVTTPSLPTTKLQGAYCGRTNVTPGRRLYSSRVLGASAYRFRITNGLDQAEYTTASASVYWFTMNDVDIPYITGTTYNVEVAVLNNGVWGPYGDVCTITTRGTAPTSREEVVKEDDSPSKVIFAVKGYPNPYTSYFTVSLETPSASMVYVRVFDMTGKLIEDREVAPSQLEELQLGSQWASGVYNVIVAQDDQLKTIRMVKQE